MVGMKLCPCLWLRSCQGHSAVVGSSAKPMWVTGACFGCREMDRRVDLSNDLLSAALVTAFCLSLFQLTGIIQGMVDGQPSLQQVLEVSRVTFSSRTLTSGPVVPSSSLSLHPPLAENRTA